MSDNSTFWRKVNSKHPGSVKRVSTTESNLQLPLSNKTEHMLKKPPWNQEKDNDQAKFDEFNSKTDEAWLDDGNTDLEFSIDPTEVGTGLSKLNLHPSLPKDFDICKHNKRKQQQSRPTLLPRSVSSPPPSDNMYSPPEPAPSSAALTSPNSVTDDTDPIKRHTAVPQSLIFTKEDKHKHKFVALLETDCPDLDKLRKMAWFGCPREYRTEVWQMLSGYLPPNTSRREDTLNRKRKEYWNNVNQYYKTRTDANFASLFHQIHIDIPRTNPAIALFQHAKVQESFERILYIWAYRNPGSGYVQGINDLVTPFYVVFLGQHVEGDVETADVDLVSDSILADTEADTYWCLSKLLDNLHDNYTFAQPGIQMKVHDLRRLVQRIDNTLDTHMERNMVEYLQFSFRWMNNLLMREMPLRCTIRLWDTYFSEPNGFSHFHLYVCAKFLTKWARVVISLNDFQAIMIFLQSLPTSKWSDDDIAELVSEAFQLKCLFPRAVTTVAGTT